LTIENTALTSLTGLENITTVGGNLMIVSNDALTSLTGLENMTSVDGVLWINYNSSLTSLTGLDNITTVGGGVMIDNNTSLTNLSGLGNLTTVGEDLMIINNSLTSLTGLENLTTVGGALGIGHNSSLTSLTGLDNITTVGENLMIINNSVLTNLCALYNVNLTGDSLAIYENTLLPMETALALETQLIINGFTGTADIHDNDGSGLVSCPCNSATVIPSSGTQVISGNTSGANNDAVPSCTYSPSAPDDLYVFTLYTETMVTASVSGFDTVLHLREVCDDPGSELACNDEPLQEVMVPMFQRSFLPVNIT
jgi:hypothetical protein